MKIVNIGYFKVDLSKEQMDSFTNNIMFKNKEVKFYSYNDLSFMLDDLRKDKIDYFIMPARIIQTNEVFDACMELVLRLNLEQIIEIYTFNSKINYENTNEITNNSYIKDDSILKFGNCSYAKSDKTVDVEFKMFKHNSYKTSILTKLFIFFFANKYSIAFNYFFNILSVLLLLLTFISVTIPELQQYLPIQVALIADAIPVITIAAQVLFKIFDIDEKAKRKMITGKWIYYSFEDKYESGNYVPRGFTTRLFEITNIGGNLTLSCKFSGSDTLFFSSENNNFQYNYSTRIADGIYSYVSNMINSKGNRADGVCKYQGRAEKNDVIKYMDGWFTGRGTGIRGRVKYYRISDKDFSILEKAYTKTTALTFKNTTVIVGVYGEMKSNTDMAFDNEFSKLDIFTGSEIIKKYYSSLSDLKRDFLSHALDFALIPTKNRAKTIENNQILVNEPLAKVIGEKDIEIKYALGSRVQDYVINENTIFLSHPQALIQCQEYINKHNAKTKDCSSTSDAAKKLMLNYCDDNTVCISNNEAIEFYNLYKVKDNGVIINPYEGAQINKTTFTLYMFDIK